MRPQSGKMFDSSDAVFDLTEFLKTLQTAQAGGGLRVATERQLAKATILNAKAANGAGTALDVSTYKDLMVVIIGASTPTLTVKCQGSGELTSNVSLDFSSAASSSNPWDYVQMYDMNDGSAVTGDTGIPFVGTADVRQFVINADALRSINFIVSGYSAGNCTVIAYPII